MIAAVQLSVGTWGGAESRFRLDRPYYLDYWYYAGLARALFAGFPAPNPAFAGTPLSQYAFHLAPLSILSSFMAPYLAMRILNLVYGGLLLLLLRRYYPERYGWIGFCVLFTAPPVYENNPLSMDLLTRGFHHFPFVLLLTVVLFERKKPILRLACAFLLPWIHGLMSLGFGAAVAWVAWREARPVLAAFGVGFLGAAAGVLLVSAGQGGGYLLESFGFDPAEALWHLVPLALTFVFARPALFVVTAAWAFVLSTVFAWNRFYLVFPLDFSLAVAAGSSRIRSARVLPAVITLAFVFFLAGMVRQFGPHRPYDPRPVAGAIDWVRRHTDAHDVFLMAPAPREILVDDTYFRNFGVGYWLLAHRDLYVGFTGWAEDLGLPGRERSLRAHEYFSGRAEAPAEVDYVYYGPLERNLYPDFGAVGATAAYRDPAVTIYEIVGGSSP